MTTAMNDTYINALLADASYVNDLTDANAKALLANRLTQPLADFITSNFEVLNQEVAPSNGFSAVVWRGKATTDYAGRLYTKSDSSEGKTALLEMLEKFDFNDKHALSKKLYLFSNGQWSVYNS